MKSTNLLWLFIIMLLIPTIALINTRTASSATEWRLYVDPPISAKEVAQVGQEFSVSIKVADVTFLYGWQFKLSWNPDLLEATSFAEGSFLKNVGNTFLGPQDRDPIDNTLGIITLYATLLGVGPYDAPSGSGTLAVISFRVKAEGECRLRLSEEMLAHRTDPLLPDQSVAHTPVKVKHGYFKFPLPILYTEPSRVLNSTLVSGFSFTINISVAKVTNLTSWQFFLEWDSNLLNATNVTEGPFLSQNDLYETNFLQQINQTEGYIHANCTLVNSDQAISGNGTIATVTFLVEETGDTYLLLPLDKSKLVDKEGATINHATVHGYFSNAFRDIAVTKVEASSTTVKAGDSMTIKVTVKNEGIATETSIDVTVTTPSPPSPTDYLIGTQLISILDVGQETTLNFTWKTKNVDKGEYTIKAEASTIPGEIDIENNIGYMDGTVKITSPGELTTILIVAVIIAVAVIGTAVFLYLRRKSPRV